MTDEVTKEDKQVPASTSEGKPEDKVEETKSENIDYKRELEIKTELLANQQEELAKKEKEISQARFTIEKQRKKAREEGIELDENEGLSKEDVSTLIDEAVNKTATKIRTDEVEPLKTEISEIKRSIVSKNAKGTDGGGGQKLPPKPALPADLSPEDVQYMKSKGFKWDHDKKGWIDSNEKFYPYGGDIHTFAG